MITASHGRSRVASVCRAELPVATSTTSPTPAPTASAATTNDARSLFSTSRCRTTRNFSPSIVGSWRLATIVPATRPRTTLRLLSPRLPGRKSAELPGPEAGALRDRGLAHLLGLVLPAEWQHQVDVHVRPCDHVARDQLADLLGVLDAGLHRGLDRGHVAADDRRHVA